MRRRGALAVAAATVAAFGLGAGLRPFHRAEASATSLDQVRHELATRYYRSVPDDVLRRQSVGGMLAALDDPYTRFLPRVEVQRARLAVQEGYSGVGLTLLPGSEGLLVTRTQPGPAQLAGIRPGDTILTVNGASVATLPFDEAVSRIVGREGSRVRLQISRTRRTLTFELVRRRLRRPSATVQSLGDGARLIRIERFSLGTSGLVRKAVVQGEAARARGLVLDLRGNPGGLLTQAAGVASLFLPRGQMVASLSGAHRPDAEIRAHAGVKTKLPVAVLVDGGSASAAEVVAGALHDQRRAAIVGERTFGKSLVQEIEPLSSGAALKLTVARFHTPSGADLSRRGIEPDVRVRDNPSTARDEQLDTALRVLTRS